MKEAERVPISPTRHVCPLPSLYLTQGTRGLEDIASRKRAGSSGRRLLWQGARRKWGCSPPQRASPAKLRSGGAVL